MANIDKCIDSYINNDSEENEEMQFIIDYNETSCRLCLGNENSVSSIFNLYYEDQKFSDLLYHCTSVQVLEDDLFTHNICSNCIVQLTTVFEFIQKCRSSDKILKATEYRNSDDSHSINSKLIECTNNNEEVKSNKEVEINTDSLDIGEITEINCSDENDLISDHVENTEDNYINDVSKYLTIKLSQNKKYKVDIIKKTRVIKGNLHQGNGSLVNQDLYKRKKVPKINQCNKCLKKFSYRYKLVHHKCIGANEKPYRCEVCSRNFRLKWNMERHQMTHTGEKLYICETCGKGFTQKGSLEEHKKIHSGYKPYICSFCGHALRRMQDLKLHLAKHTSPDEDEIEENNDEGFKCKICQKMLSSLRALRVHKSIEHEPKGYLCSICGKSFVSKPGLITHGKIHTGDKPYSCEYCHQKFTYKSSLRDHKFRHTGERPYVCKVCDRGFLQHHHLTQHMRTHTGEKPFSCKFCNKSFSLKANLTVHTRIHTGETPFVCDICSIGFYDSSSLKKHRIKNDH